MTRGEAKACLQLLTELRELLQRQACAPFGWIGIGVYVFSWAAQKQSELEVGIK